MKRERGLEREEKLKESKRKESERLLD